MKKHLTLLLLWAMPLSSLFATDTRVEMNLNGTWQFDQTTTAFPPDTYTRTCPVPGLVHLATPKIEGYDRYFQTRDKAMLDYHKGFLAMNRTLRVDYTPTYNWYRKEVFVPQELKGKKASIYIAKSRFVTQVYVNGIEVGSSISCYTPVELFIDKQLKYGEKNEILIRVGDRQWLPREAAGSFDPDLAYYLPGIWDNVSLIFTEQLRVQRVMVLPQALNGKVTVKTLLNSLYKRREDRVSSYQDSCTLTVQIREKISGKTVAEKRFAHNTLRGHTAVVEDVVPLPDAHLWTPDDPFLYEAVITLKDKGVPSDRVVKTFGMRDFEQRGKDFYLNGERIFLRGTNLTLHRFFEDTECDALPWDRAWVTRLLTEVPKAYQWNAMRNHLGLLPDMWYEIADSCGLMYQNEWMYWFIYGEQQQIEKEFGEWLWADACHPSIVIWDAMNECSDSIIGNVIIPKMKKLDPSRIWDNGYMGKGFYWGTHDEKNVSFEEMDEPHLYSLSYIPDTLHMRRYLEHQPFHLGIFDNLHEFFGKTPWCYTNVYNAQVPQVCNEFAWMWLWRNGEAPDMTKGEFDYFAGTDATPEERWALQAYWTQIEIEWLRVEREIDGILTFSYLTGDYGVTGDWWQAPVRALKPTLTLKWMKHPFRPVAAFPNLQDQRYMKYGNYYNPRETLTFDLVGVNDYGSERGGRYTVRLIDSRGKTVKRVKGSLTIPAYYKTYHPVTLTLPAKEDGYLLLVEFVPEGEKEPVLSRRYINVGAGEKHYYDYPLE